MKKTALLISLSVACMSAPLQSFAEDAPDLTQVKSNFDSADANGDGALSKEEFTNFVNANADDGIGRAPMIRKMKAYNRAFKTLDGDEDGLVTWEEFLTRQKK